MTEEDLADLIEDLAQHLTLTAYMRLLLKPAVNAPAPPLQPGAAPGIMDLRFRQEEYRREFRRLLALYGLPSP